MLTWHLPDIWRNLANSGKRNVQYNEGIHGLEGWGAVLVTTVRLGFWYYGWNVLALVVVLQALTIGLLFTSFSFWIEPWGEQFGVGRGEVLFIVTVFNLIVGFLGPVVGTAVDRFSKRWLTVIGLTALALGLSLISVVESFWQIFAIYVVLMPVAMSFSGALMAQALAVRWFPDRGGFAIGISALGTSLGGIVMPIVVAIFLEAGGWRLAHQYLALLVVLFIPVAWLLLTARMPDVPEKAEHDKTRQAVVSAAEIFKSRSFWLLVLMFVPLYFSLAGFQYNIVPFLSDEGISTSMAALVVSAMSLSAMLSKLIFGWLMDRFDHRLVYGFAVLGMCAGFFLAITVSTMFIVVAVAFFGLFAGSLLPIRGAVVLSQFGAAFYGRAIGLITPFTMGAASLGPLVVGFARDHGGSYDFVFITMALLILPGILVSALLSSD